jgi:carbon-monoxide dehydrogenase medium subunit
VADVGIGLTAVGAAHFCAPLAEAALLGKPATEENLKAAAEVAAGEARPQTDQRGPADYKRHLAGELTRRALRRSVARARAPGGMGGVPPTTAAGAAKERGV